MGGLKVSERDSEKFEKKELKWTEPIKKGPKISSIETMQITCKPCIDEEALSKVQVQTEPHTFEVKKVYIFEDNGKSEGIVICPIHHRPIAVNVLPPGGSQQQKLP
jgi:hypothetical protein